MRVVLDTNVFISALLIPTSHPAALISLWREGKFEPITASRQLDELVRVTRYPKIRERLTPALAGRLINELRDLAVIVPKLPIVEASPDPYDNYLLSIAVGGAADYLVTGDKNDLLALKKYQGVPIVTVRHFIDLTGRR
jgi:putative PIN family toxin of toxin-antitoxin system